MSLYKLRMYHGIRQTRGLYIVAHTFGDAEKYSRQCYPGETPLVIEIVSRNVHITREVIEERFNEDE